MIHKLYNYAPKEVDVLTTGLWSPSVAPRKALSHYFGRARTQTKKGVLAYLESSFPGRSRSISFITSPMTAKSILCKDFQKDRRLYSVDFDALLKANLIESIYRCHGKTLTKIGPDKIAWKEALPWEKVGQGLFFKVIPHYMIVMKRGLVPAEYISLEKSVCQK